MSGKLRTENNIPNRKVNAGMITGILVTVILIVAPYLKIQLPAQEVLNQQVGAVVAGVTALIYLVQWLTRPGKGDGIKEE